MKKRMRLFKNDRFGIKARIFKLKLSNSLKEHANISCKLVNIAIKAIDNIGIPTTDKDIERLRKYVDIYDNSIAELEKHVKYARIYLKPSDK